MGFLEKTITALTGSEEFLPLSYRAIISGGRSAYFENIKCILSFSKEKVVLQLKKGSITVKGEDLSVIRYEVGDACIGGKIKAIEIDG